MISYYVSESFQTFSSLIKIRYYHINNFFESIDRFLYSNLLTRLHLFPTVAPKIDRKNLRDITVRENEGFHFDVKIIGEPPPDVTWVINNKSIQQTTFRRIQNVPYNSKFFNDKPERKDSGIYKITAVNQYGSDTAEVEVTVVCKF